jgi:branched-chain amino acid transport system substrate-binding protein
MAMISTPSDWPSETVSRRTFLRAAGGVGAGLAAPALLRAATATEPVRIGSLADLSGPTSTDSGMMTIYSAQLAIEDFGPQILGRPIELLTADDQNKADVGSVIARKWLDQDGASTIISNSFSPLGLSIKRMCVDRQKPFLMGSTASSAFTQDECSPLTAAFGVNSYCMLKAVVSALLKKNLDTWFFITTDYTFAHALEADASSFVNAGGDKVIGAVRSPIGNPDFSAQLLQAQASGAKVIALAVQGIDFQNVVKQATEFHVTRSGQTVAALYTLDNQIIGAGLENTAGMSASSAFYWDMDDDTRAFTRRIMKKSNGVAPTVAQVAGYSAMLHYLRGVQAAGTLDGPAVVAAMKATPVNDFWSRNVRIREDGQTLRPMLLMQVKTRAESKSRYDIFDIKGTIPPEEAWKPLSESACPFIRKT